MDLITCSFYDKLENSPKTKMECDISRDELPKGEREQKLSPNILLMKLVTS